MNAKIDHYARTIIGAIRRGHGKETLGRRLVVYVGNQDFMKILQYGHEEGQLSRPGDAGVWFFMGCELVEVQREEWFEVAFWGQYQ